MRRESREGRRVEGGRERGELLAGLAREPLARELVERGELAPVRPLGERALPLLELPVEPLELAVRGLELRHGLGVRLRLDDPVELVADAPVELTLVLVRVVDDRAELAETQVRDPPVDHVEGGALVADEEDALAPGEVIADHVRDRLRLPGARGPVDHETARRAREPDGARLARVGLGHEALLGEDACRRERVGLARRRAGRERRLEEALDRSHEGDGALDHVLHVSEEGLVRERVEAEDRRGEDRPGALAVIRARRGDEGLPRADRARVHLEDLGDVRDELGESDPGLLRLLVLDRLGRLHARLLADPGEERRVRHDAVRSGGLEDDLGRGARLDGE